MSNKVRPLESAGLEIETMEGTTDLHIYPRESRRGKAQWAVWLKTDGSALIFVGDEQVILPKNDLQNAKHEMVRNKDNQLEFKKV
jgi:hypothetical protein